MEQKTIIQSIGQYIRKCWWLLTWKGLRYQDRLKLWGTELCAIMVMGTVEHRPGLSLLFCTATLAMLIWTNRTISMKDLDALMRKIDD